MKRRNFLSLIGAAAVAPALPTFGASAPVTIATGYNRYQYGLAVFHARTRASVTAADIMTRLKVNAVQANAMLGEMSTSGVLSRTLGGAHAARASHSGLDARPYVRRAMRQITDAMAAPETEAVCTPSAPDVHTEQTVDHTPPDSAAAGQNSGVQS